MLGQLYMNQHGLAVGKIQPLPEPGAFALTGVADAFLNSLRRFGAIGLIAASAIPARAEQAEQQFESFFRNQQRYEQQVRKYESNSGIVLESGGKNSGQLSLGGRSEEYNPYSKDAPDYNFNSRFNDDVDSQHEIAGDGDGVLNLRFKF